MKKKKLKKLLSKSLPDNEKITDVIFLNMTPSKDDAGSKYYDLRIYIEKDKLVSFEEGKWYYYPDSKEYALYPNACGFNIHGEWMKDDAFLFDSRKEWKLADMKEVEKLLIDKAEKDYPDGCKVECLFDSKEEYITSNKKINYNNGNIEIWDGDNTLLYFNGKWAEKRIDLSKDIKKHIPKHMKATDIKVIACTSGVLSLDIILDEKQ